MNKPILLRLALQNIKNNSRYTMPYMLTCIGTVVMAYNVSAIRENTKDMWGADYISMYMMIGLFIIAIFALIFLLYTNRFVINQRKKELGLYTVLGLEKSHVCMMTLIESTLMFLISLTAGILFGILFNKLLLMLLFKLMKVAQAAKFTVMFQSIKETAIIFFVIYVLTVLSNMITVIKRNPIDLLKSQSEGEKEPRASIIITLIGFLTLGGGYYLAVTISDIVSAVLFFFVAVFLVIIGTYCLFTSGSISLLKTLKMNKRYYYKPNHFVSVSSLIYRMKQNAVGLGNICILSTMVLVIITSTLTIYVGVDEMINSRYPYDYNYTFNNYMEFQQQDTIAAMEEVLKKLNRDDLELVYFTYNKYLASSEDAAALADAFQENNFSLRVMPLSSYNRATEQNIRLGEDEMLLYLFNQQKVLDVKELFCAGKTWTVNPITPQKFVSGPDAAIIGNIYYIIVADDNLPQFGIDVEHEMTMIAGINGEMSEEERELLYSSMKSAVDTSLIEAPQWFTAEGKEDNSQDFFALYGGFLFLGIFLGTLFMMATVLIIYYKQITEGFEDKKRFEILQKVGMDKKEIKSTINDQILLVFFLPLITAVIHTCFAYPLVKKILSAIALGNVQQYLKCTLITTGCFILIYSVVYKVTARAYMKIVEEKL